MKDARAVRYRGRHAALPALLCALMLIAGCQAPSGAGDTAPGTQDPREVAARFVASQENITDYAGTMIVSDIFQPYNAAAEKLPKVTRTMTVRVWHMKPYRYRFLYYNTSNALVSEEILNDRDYVFNDSAVNQVIMQKVADPRSLGILNYDFQAIAREIMEEKEPTFGGTQNLDGRSNYVFHAEFGAARTYHNRLIRNATLWIDTDRLVLSQMEIYNEQGELHERITYRDIRINTGLSDRDFAFTPLERATISSV